MTFMARRVLCSRKWRRVWGRPPLGQMDGVKVALGSSMITEEAREG